MDFQILRGESLCIYVSAEENSAVQIAAGNLVRDLSAVVGAYAQICPEVSADINGRGRAESEECADNRRGTVPMAGHRVDERQCVAERISKIVIRTGLSDDIIGAERLKDENGNYRKEGFSIAVSDGRLFITGADRRGTIYGIYDFCESIGVSPWYWWADVPVKQKDEICIADGFVKTDYPTIEYRGIFINDEEELENWVQAHMGEDTIGVKTYEPLFELLLRLKANYIWPAMHVNSFNVKKENGALADRMGIVVGTSHCDILMRSNNREWYPWLESMGYQNVEYDYSIEGRNREILDEYWDNSIKQNRDFEVCYTLGMRGIHDWGCSMRTIDERTDLTLEEKKKAKVDMLSFIINRQRELLAQNGVDDSMQIFIPYKEVLDMYDNGLKVPEDVTLVWANDNFGYVRRFPSVAEQARPGGNGVYYHVSYWAWPEMDYLFIGSTPLAHIKNEMRKCYDNGIRKLWVLNVGAMKPLEQEMEFFIRYAWEIGKSDAASDVAGKSDRCSSAAAVTGKRGSTDEEVNEGNSTDDIINYLASWIQRNFSIAEGMETAQILNDFAQLTNVRKVEHMSYDIFAQYAYGDEGARRINRYEDLYNRANRIYASLPENEKDAFYQLVLMKIHAAYYINLEYYYADRSYLCHRDGKLSAANYYTELSREADYYKREMLEYYNKKMSGGKWDQILTPEEYKPPVTALFPPRTPSLEEGEDGLGVVLWDHGDEICLDRYSVNPKWIELYNPGEGEIEYEIEAGEGIAVSICTGKLKYEKRLFIEIKGRYSRSEIIIRNKKNNSEIKIPLKISDFEVPEDFEGYVEADGYVSIPADGHLSNPTEVDTLTFRKDCGLKDGAKRDSKDSQGRDLDWRIIEYMGRGGGKALEASKDYGKAKLGSIKADILCEDNFREDDLSTERFLKYRFYLRKSGEFTAEIFRFPTLNSVGRIRAAVRVDGGEEIIVESISNDEWRGTWKQNVMSNVDRMEFKLPYLAEGAHVLEIAAIDRYFTFSGIVIYTEEKKPCYLAPRASYYRELYRELSNQNSPVSEEIPQLPDDFYGFTLPPRDTVYAGSKCWINNGLIDSNIRKPLAAYPQLDYTIASGIICEQGGAIRIDAQSALAQDDNAFIKGGAWEYADSETGISMHIRQKGLRWNDLNQSPSLNYRISISQPGNYHIWLLMKLNVEPTSVAFGLDGNPQPLCEQYNRGELWCYEAKQIWRWTPICDMELSEGEHIFSIYAVTSEVRIDRVYMTQGDELPPDAIEW